MTSHIHSNAAPAKRIAAACARTAVEGFWRMSAGAASLSQQAVDGKARVHRIQGRI